MDHSHHVGGVDLAYYALCKRKLWLYKKGIRFENESDRVMQGKVLHDTSYPHLEKKEILIDNAFKIDAIDGDYIREIKISSKMEKSDVMQMLFYLYQLSLRGVKKKGLISYTKEKKTVKIFLTDENVKKVKKAIADVYKILEKSSPPTVIKYPYCKSCAYNGFCYIKEDEEDDA